LGFISTYSCYVVIGIAYTGVPGALWPAIPLTINDSVGTAYGILFTLMSLGYFVVPMLAGAIRDSTGIYAGAQILYSVIAGFAFIFALLTQREDKKFDNSLQKPSITIKPQSSSSTLLSPEPSKPFFVVESSSETPSLPRSPSLHELITKVD